MYDMEYSPAPPWPTIFKYGLIGGASLIILNTFVFVSSGQFDIFGYTGAMMIGNLLALVLYVLIMIFSLLEYRDQRSRGYLSIGKGIIVSYGSTMLMGVISLFFSIFYLLVIDPDYMNRIMRREYGELLDDSATTTIDQEPLITSGVLVSSYVASFILGCIIGLIISLIISAIMKKDPPFNSRYQY